MWKTSAPGATSSASAPKIDGRVSTVWMNPSVAVSGGAVTASDATATTAEHERAAAPRAAARKSWGTRPPSSIRHGATAPRLWEGRAKRDPDSMGSDGQHPTGEAPGGAANA